MSARQVLSGAARRVAAAPRLLVPPPVSVQSRMYATPASERIVKPPLQLFGLDGNYATALYTAAVKMSALEPTARGIAALAELLKREPKLQTTLSMPTLGTADRAAVAEVLQRGAGTAAGEAVSNLLAAMAENNRLSLLGKVCDKFAQLMRAAQGEVEMTVTSAQALDSRTLSRLESAVAKSTYVGQGKKLKVNNEVDPDIIGGLVVQLGDRTIDLSVASQMRKMNEVLTEAQ